MPEPDGWVRLHPLSPLLNAGRFVLAAVVLTAQSWAEAFETLPGGQLVIRVGAAVVVGGLAALAYSAIAWRFRMYRLTSEMVELKTGIVFRSYRHLPLERIESVDTARSLVPRLLGLAEVRVEAISKKRTELRLRYLSLEDAERLRLELSALRRSAVPEQSVPEAAPALILQVPARELVMGYVLIPVVMGALALVPAVLVAAAVAGWQQAALLVVFAGAVALAAVVPGLLRVERLWDFRLEDAGGTLVIHRGLLNLNTQRIVTGRVQALRIDQPLLWRPYERFRVVVDVAGYRGASDQVATAAANLLPIATEDVVRYLVHRLEVRADLAGLPYEPVPRRARWRSLRWSSFALAWTDTHTIVKAGVLWRRTAVVPHRRVQSVRVTQGPWQRCLRLATLRIDTAGSRVRAHAAHRDVGEAIDLANRFAPRVRHSS